MLHRWREASPADLPLASRGAKTHDRSAESVKCSAIRTARASLACLRSLARFDRPLVETSAFHFAGGTSCDESIAHSRPGSGGRVRGCVRPQANSAGAGARTAAGHVDGRGAAPRARLGMRWWRRRWRRWSTCWRAGTRRSSGCSRRHRRCTPRRERSGTSSSIRSRDHARGENIPRHVHRARAVRPPLLRDPR